MIKTVDSVLEMVVQWIKNVAGKEKAPFQGHFDFLFFGNAIQAMLSECDLFSSYKCLWMLYQVMEYMPGMWIKLIFSGRKG